MIDISIPLLVSGLIVFISRIFDRMIVVIELNYLNKGKNVLLFVAAFVETVIWCLCSSFVLKSGNVYQIIGYILGFAVGNTAGIFVLDLFSRDILSVRVYVPRTDAFLIKCITDASYGATLLKCSGKEHDDNLMIIVNTSKKNLRKLLNIIKNNTPNAFVAVYDTRGSINGYVNTKFI